MRNVHMKVNKHICFSNEKAPELVEYLRTNNIPYKNTLGLLTLDILDNNSHWLEIYNIVQQRQLVCLSETTFSNKELTNASWLAVRSNWRCGYPQPEGQFGYQKITYEAKEYCEACGHGLRQIEPFRLKSSPKWGNRHFMMLNWVEDELFLDNTAKEVLKDNGFTGIGFTSVRDKNGVLTLPGIFQLTIEAKTGLGLLEEQDSIQDVYTCSNCGQRKYHPSGIGMYSFDRTIFENMPDICKTSEIFGWGKSAHHLILINRKVYQMIVKNQLGRGLVFAPINLV